MEKSNALRWPHLGIGLSYRSNIHGSLTTHLDEIDCLEVLVEDLVTAPDRADYLTSMTGRLPIILHGISLSLGSPGALRTASLKTIRQRTRRMPVQWIGEHIAFTNAGSIALPTFTPVPFTIESAKAIQNNAMTLSHVLDIPVLLENIVYHFIPPNSDLSESAFIRMVIENSPFGLLLDLTNVSINAQNHGYDPYEFISSLPIDHLAQVHLAGGTQRVNQHIIDTHDGPVPDDVWRLLEFVASRRHVPAVIIERESNFPQIELLLEEVKHARCICQRS